MSSVRTYILAAALVVVAVSEAGAQQPSITQIRGLLTEAVKKDCLADRKGSRGAVTCACEARERVSLAGDAEIARLMRGTDADRAQMHKKLRADSGKALMKCLAQWGYGLCLKEHSDVPRSQAKTYCGCVSETYAKANANASDYFSEADRARCQKRAGWPAG